MSDEKRELSRLAPVDGFFDYAFRPSRKDPNATSTQFTLVSSTVRDSSARVDDHSRRFGRLTTAFAEIKLPLILGTFVFLVIVVGYRVAGFSLLFSDVGAYIKWSYDPTAHSSYESHVPGYPAMIYLLRTVTYGLLPDVILAQLICYVFWVISLLLARNVLAIWAPELRDLGVLCIALSPLVGISLAAYPYTECVARAFLFAALLTGIHRRWTAFAIIVAGGLFIHQAYYPMYLFLALTFALTKGMSWLYMLASGIPLVGYYGHVALSKGDPFWIVRGHYRMHLAKVETYPIFDGIIQTFQEGTSVSLVRGILLVTVTALAIGLLIYSLKRKQWCLVAITAPIVLFAVLASRDIAFIVIRLSPVLVLPLSVMLATKPGVTAFLKRRGVRVSLAAMLAMSQFLWAFYIYKKWTGHAGASDVTIVRPLSADIARAAGCSSPARSGAPFGQIPEREIRTCDLSGV